MICSQFTVKMLREEGWLKMRKQAHTDAETYSMWTRKKGPTLIPYFPEKEEKLKSSSIYNRYEMERQLLGGSVLFLVHLPTAFPRM